MNLLPYVAREAEHAASAGTPLMRPLLLNHPDDSVAWTITDQYRFGRSFLVAPVVEEDATTRTLYLPDGVWIDFWSGERHEGGQWLTVDAPWDRIPVFAPAGSVIPLRLGAEGRLGEDTGNGLSLTNGLTWWLASDPETQTGGDTELGIRFGPGDDGRLIVSVPPLDYPLRIAAPGYQTFTVAASEEPRQVEIHRS
jgi:hypothetical protein